MIDNYNGKKQRIIHCNKYQSNIHNMRLDTDSNNTVYISKEN